MKTHLFYSPANSEVVAVVADGFQQASGYLNRMLTNSGTIIKDDYIYHGSLTFADGNIATVGVKVYDNAFGDIAANL